VDPKHDNAPIAKIAGKRIALVVARYYAEVADMLIEGARAALAEASAQVDVIEVPGAFEIPSFIAHLSDRYHGFVALGCVIRGETTHYDYVCGESARALMDLAVRDKLAIGFGILTVETMEQAIDRADPKRRNKGREAARACAALVDLAASLRA
jgi:6,7-dimethyl-8-ribityllumazine synthase